jgi:hypothetical protein
MHKNTEHIACAHQPAVKEGKPRQCHKQHKRCGDDNPSGVRSVHLIVPPDMFFRAKTLKMIKNKAIAVK